MKNIELKPWEEICPDCEGKCETYRDLDISGIPYQQGVPFPCETCDGEGKVVKEGFEMYALTDINIKK